jgi:hypothetical protein
MLKFAGGDCVSWLSSGKPRISYPKNPVNPVKKKQII